MAFLLRQGFLPFQKEFPRMLEECSALFAELALHLLTHRIQCVICHSHRMEMICYDLRVRETHLRHLVKRHAEVNAHIFDLHAFLQGIFEHGRIEFVWAPAGKNVETLSFRETVDDHLELLAHIPLEFVYGDGLIEDYGGRTDHVEQAGCCRGGNVVPFCDSASRNELCMVVDDFSDVGVGDAVISCDEGMVLGEYFFAFGAKVTALLVDDLFSRM